ncbi:MAG TPA: dihydropteroate synthase [Phycisphaerales bacterium]|nr:dihydropteroate synthase [Phycisphaerales bacterium]
MAILNATPDSFSDGGRHLDPKRALHAAQGFVRDGADIIDIGGESTRPGSEAVPDKEQIRRVVPVIGAIRSAGLGVAISIDTTRAAVAAEALDAGADAINDVSGGTDDPAMLRLAAERGCGIVLMHRLTRPDADRYSDRYERPPEYGDVVEAVRADLASKAARAIEAGCVPAALVLDPGLGFGKSVEQNVALVRGTDRIASIGFPLLGAASRKSFIGRLSMGPMDETPPPPSDRLGGSIAFTLAQLAAGVRLFRVHDVAEQARALRVAWEIREGEGPGSGKSVSPARVSRGDDGP